ncbi:MAG: zinc ABC transporter permease AztB [Aeromicrobium sp.]
MIDLLLAPFEPTFMTRALVGGLLVAAISALVGVWIIVRGLTFLGEAMSHGMLPGVAIASLLGGNPMIGAGVAGLAMALGAQGLRRGRFFGQDTAIGVLYVGLLALGVIIVSRAQSFATDLTAFLFGDVLAIQWGDVFILTGALVVVALASLLLYRPFLALSIDARVAQTLGMRPRPAGIAMLVLLTITLAASFHVVGTLLAFGMLVAPSAAAMLLAKRIPVAMLLAWLFGSIAVVGGLLLSWHASTAAGASIAVVAVALFLLVALGRGVRSLSLERTR